MNIPKRFQLGSRTWKVKRGAELGGDYGACSSSKCVIRLAAKNKPGEEELHTFCHELVHAIKFTLGDKMPHDEEYTDAFGNVLAQFLTTMEFDE
jgi:hypothetical protein